MYHTLWYQVRIMYQIRIIPGTRMYHTCRCTINSTAVSLFVYSSCGWWYAWYLRSAQETAVSLFVYSLVGGGIARTFRPWTHKSDDSYIYQLSLVVATATVSFYTSKYSGVTYVGRTTRSRTAVLRNCSTTCMSPTRDPYVSCLVWVVLQQHLVQNTSSSGVLVPDPMSSDRTPTSKQIAILQCGRDNNGHYILLLYDRLPSTNAQVDDSYKNILLS